MKKSIMKTGPKSDSDKDLLTKQIAEVQANRKRLEEERDEARRKREFTALVPEIRVHGAPSSSIPPFPVINILDLGKIAFEIAKYADKQNLKSSAYNFPLYEAMPDTGLIILATKDLGVLCSHDSSDHKTYGYAGLMYTSEIKDMKYQDIGPLLFGFGIALHSPELLIYNLDQVVLGPPEQIELPPTYGYQEKTGKYFAALTLQGLLESDVYKEKKEMGQVIVIGKPKFNTSSSYLPYNKVLQIKIDATKKIYPKKTIIQKKLVKKS